MQTHTQDRIVEYRGLQTLSTLYQSAVADHAHNADLRKQISDAFLALGFKDGSYDLTMSSSASMGGGFGLGGTGGGMSDDSSGSSPGDGAIAALNRVHASNLEDWFELDRSVRIHRELMRAVKNIAVQTWQNYADDADGGDAGMYGFVGADDPGGVDYHDPHHDNNSSNNNNNNGDAGGGATNVGGIFSPMPRRMNRAPGYVPIRGSGAYCDSPPPRHKGSPGKPNSGGKRSVFRKIRGAIRKTRSDLRGVLAAAEGGGHHSGSATAGANNHNTASDTDGDMDEGDVLSLRFLSNPPSLDQHLSTGNLAPPPGQGGSGGGGYSHRHHTGSSLSLIHI